MGLDASVHFMIVTNDISIFVHTCLHTAEGKEWLEAQYRGTMTVHQGVTYQHTCIVRLEDDFPLEDYTTHTIERSRNGFETELANILMSVRAEHPALILVDAKIEFSAMLDHRGIKR